jgi:O-antigen ligase
MTGWKKALTFLRSEGVQSMADTVMETSFLGFLSLFFFSNRAADFALILMGLSLIVRRFSAPSFVPQTSLAKPLLFFFFSLLLSALFSETRAHSFRQVSSEILKTLVIFYGTLEYLRGQDRFRRVFWASAWVVFVIGADGLLQFVLGQDLIRGAALWKGRVRAHFSSPTFFEYALPLFPFPLLLLEQGRDWWKRAFLALVVIAFAASCVLSGTRSVWIALALILLLVALPSRHRVLYLSLIGILILALAILPVAKSKKRLSSLGDLVAEQKYQRMLAWQITYRMFLSRPVLGKGPDFFEKYERNEELQKPYLPPSLAEEVKARGKRMVFPIYHPHSIYLEILASQGLVGMAAFLSILIALFFSLGRGRRGPPLLFRGTLASLLSFLICGAAGTSFYRLWSYGIFWLLAGIGLALKGGDEIGS